MVHRVLRVSSGTKPFLQKHVALDAFPTKVVGLLVRTRKLTKFRTLSRKAAFFYDRSWLRQISVKSLGAFCLNKHFHRGFWLKQTKTCMRFVSEPPVLKSPMLFGLKTECRWKAMGLLAETLCIFALSNQRIRIDGDCGCRRTHAAEEHIV